MNKDFDLDKLVKDIDKDIDKVVSEIENPPLLASRVILELRGIIEELRQKTDWFHSSKYEYSLFDLIDKVRETQKDDRYNTI